MRRKIICCFAVPCIPADCLIRQRLLPRCDSAFGFHAVTSLQLQFAAEQQKSCTAEKTRAAFRNGRLSVLYRYLYPYITKTFSASLYAYGIWY